MDRSIHVYIGAYCSRRLSMSGNSQRQQYMRGLDKSGETGFLVHVSNLYEILVLEILSKSIRFRIIIVKLHHSHLIYEPEFRKYLIGDLHSALRRQSHIHRRTGINMLQHFHFFRRLTRSIRPGQDAPTYLATQYQRFPNPK